MNFFKEYINQKSIEAIKYLFQKEIKNVEIQLTKKEFEGDYTLVVFPLLQQIKGNLQQIAQDIGSYLVQNHKTFTNYNVAGGFLNLSLDSPIFTSFLTENYSQKNYGFSVPKNITIMLEYASPNTNKPIHLGHIRNNVLGYSMAQIKAANGYKVIKSQIINDRGIHICKSMVAYQLFGNQTTPKSTSIKGDKFVGNYYVKFDQEYQKQIQELVAKGIDKEQAQKEAPIFQQAQQMLLDWENGNEEVLALWKTMNNWVYNGFNETYHKLGVNFDVIQYESNTYKLGKDVIQEGLVKNVFQAKEDGAIFCDLSQEGHDEKIVQRKDGTSVYITQDLGTVVERFKDYDITELIYTVGNEQDYHFKVLFSILKKLGYDWAKNLHHLSYGMVDLPEGKMKSREGTVVDADDIIQEMTQTAQEIANELGRLEDFSTEDKKKMYQIIGLAALKYFILKVDAKKRILFDPKESIDFNGNTGPFILYTYARIQSILRKTNTNALSWNENVVFNAAEKNIIKHIAQFNEVIQKASETLNPSLVANFVYDLVKHFNSFYQSHSILQAESEMQKNVRIAIAIFTANTIANALSLLGINTVERM